MPGVGRPVLPAGEDDPLGERRPGCDSPAPGRPRPERCPSLWLESSPGSKNEAVRAERGGGMGDVGQGPAYFVGSGEREGPQAHGAPRGRPPSVSEDWAAGLREEQAAEGGAG